MELDIIKTETTWNDASASINSNNRKINDAIEKLMQGGSGGGSIANVKITTNAPAYLSVSANPTQDGVELQVNPTIPTSINSETSGFASVKAVKEWSDNELLSKADGGYPKTNNKANLGSPTNQWKGIYAKDFCEDGVDLQDKYMPKNILSVEPIEQKFTWRVATDNRKLTDSLAVVNKIIGNTIRWSQLVDRITTNNTDNTAFVDQEGKVSVSYNNGEITITNSATKTKDYSNVTIFGELSSVNLQIGHNYLICADRAHYGIGIVEGTITTSFHQVNSIFTASYNTKPRFAISPNYDFSVEHSYSGDGLTVTQKTISMKLNLFDLTDMFGKDKEPESLGEFRRLYPRLYYDACVIPKVRGIVIDSFASPNYNLWNKGEAVVGAVMYASGWLRSDSYYKGWYTYIMPVSPNTRYYLKDVANRSQCMPCVYYDADMKWVGYDGPQSLDTSTYSASGEIVTPDNVSYMAVMVHKNYIDRACVSVSSRRNGDYEPYNSEISFDEQIRELFPYGLLEGGGVFDEVGEGYAIQRVAYGLDANGNPDPDSFKQVQITNSAGNKVNGFNYYPLDNRLWMTWRLRRGGTERIRLGDVSAPFRATISYALDSNDLLAKPIKVRNDESITLLAIDDEGTTFDTDMLIGKDKVDIEWGMDKTIPTCKAVKDAIDASIAASIPTQAAPSTPKEILSTLSLSQGVSLQPNIVYECLTAVSTARIALVVPTNNYDNVWVFRGILSKGATLTFATNLTIKWENGIEPSFTTTQYIEIRLKRFGTTSTYLASWSAYPYN